MFADKTDAFDLWALKLEGWNVEVPRFVQEMIAVGEARMLLRAATIRFGPPATETRQFILKISDEQLLGRMMERVFVARDWSDLLTMQ